MLLQEMFLIIRNNLPIKHKFIVNLGLNVRIPNFYKISSQRNPKYVHEYFAGYF